MAGIGFSLKRLFSKKGVFNLCKAYGYAGIVTIGPMILGVLLLVGIGFVAGTGGMSDFDRELLNIMLTYSLLVALMITTVFNMIITRYVSDMIYQDTKEKVMPSFYGCVAIEVVLCILTYGVFLIFSRPTLLQGILCLWLAIILIIVWTEIIYMTALKDFQAIVVTFTISLMIGLILSLITVLLGITSLEVLLLCVIIAYGILAVRQYEQMLGYFPKSRGSCFSWLRYFDRYPTLSLSGTLIRVGLFAHIIIMYFGPLRVQVKGYFYGAPEYDVPALIAFFSLLITTISFVVSVEVNFYPKYSNYYGLFADNGAINDIKLANKEMLDVLQRELFYLGIKQVFTTILFVVVGPPVINILFPGFSSLSMTIYKFLCLGYGAYAVANSIMLIQLYFEDYNGAFIGTLLFSAISTAVTIYQVMYGDIHYFGVGFFLGSIAFYIYALVRLDWYTRRLPYFLLSRQSLLPNKEKGLLTFISKKLDARQDELNARIMAEEKERAKELLQKEGLKP